MSNNGADQTVRMRRLICAFDVRLWHKQVFSWRGSNRDRNLWYYPVRCLQLHLNHITSKSAFGNLRPGDCSANQSWNFGYSNYRCYAIWATLLFAYHKRQVFSWWGSYYPIRYLPSHFISKNIKKKYINIQQTEMRQNMYKTRLKYAQNHIIYCCSQMEDIPRRHA